MTNVQTIRIETLKGKLIERKAVVADFLDSQGRESALAQVGIFAYRVLRRDSQGPIFRVIRFGGKE